MNLRRRKIRYSRSDAGGNIFFLCHKRRFMFLAISKNASTSLKELLYVLESGRAPGDIPADIHRTLGWRAKRGRAIDRRNRKALAKYQDYFRFVVYRDPVDRFLSAYHSQVLYPPRPHPFYVRNRLEGMALDPFLDIVEEILRIENPLHIDEHLRPQRRYYEWDDVDEIVEMDSLNEFLLRTFQVRRIPSANAIVAPRVTVTQAQIARIRELYREDYTIPTTYPAIKAAPSNTEALRADAKAPHSSTPEIAAAVMS